MNGEVNEYRNCRSEPRKSGFINRGSSYNIIGTEEKEAATQAVFGDGNFLIMGNCTCRETHFQYLDLHGEGGQEGINS